LIKMSLASLLMNISRPFSSWSTCGNTFEWIAHPLSYNANTMLAMSLKSPFSRFFVSYKSTHYQNSLEPSPATANAHIKFASSFV